MTALRYARQYTLAEIGTTGQHRLESAHVRAGAGDARASEIMIAYLERAGVAIAASGEALDVASSDEVSRIAGRADLVEAAAFLVGALAATRAIAHIAEVPARPVTNVPVLSG